MIREPIPEDIKRFILRSIASIPHLEAILLLRGKPDQVWSERNVAERLYISERAAASLLEELSDAGFIRIRQADPPAYRYQPSSDQLQQMIERLADCYSKNLLEVTNLIHSKLDRKAQQFADAFKWRKN